MREDTEALLVLHAAGGRVAPRRALLEDAGGPQAAVVAGTRAWRRHGLDEQQAAALRAPDERALDRARAWLEHPGHHLIGWHDPDYPALLRQAPNPPLALFVAGDPALPWHPAVAVVGSRAATAGGRDNAADFARALAAAGFSVASGLAAGIDTAAHEATLAVQGRTLAVLGTGPDVPYPRANAALHARIATHGAIVSEHLPGTQALREHFPSRNRILAGLALGTVVVEAAERSGALITARLAAEAGREVFALPGSIHNPKARGCHRLIRDGVTLARSAQDVIAALAPVADALATALRGRLGLDASPAAPAVDGPRDAPSPADADHQTLWRAIDHAPTDMDQLVSRTGLTAAVLSSMLLAMELDGRIVVEHGRYARKR